MTLEEGENLIQTLLSRYEHVFSQEGGNPGERFDRVYDLKTLRPTMQWEDTYKSVKAELNQLGLKVP
jgi:hypothetical protein